MDRDSPMVSSYIDSLSNIGTRIPFSNTQNRLTILVYIILVIIIAITIVGISVFSGNDNFRSSLVMPMFSLTPSILVTIWGGFMLLFGSSTYLVLSKLSKNSKSKTSSNYNAAVNTLFLVFMGIILFFIPILYSTRFINTSLVISIVLLVLSVILFWLYYKISRIAAYLMFPIILWLCYIVYFILQLIKLNP